MIGGTGEDTTATRALFFSVHVQLFSNFELMVSFKLSMIIHASDRNSRNEPDSERRIIQSEAASRSSNLLLLNASECAPGLLFMGD